MSKSSSKQLMYVEKFIESTRKIHKLLNSCSSFADVEDEINLILAERRAVYNQIIQMEEKKPESPKKLFAQNMDLLEDIILLNKQILQQIRMFQQKLQTSLKSLSGHQKALEGYRPPLEKSEMDQEV